MSPGWRRKGFIIIGLLRHILRRVALWRERLFAFMSRNARSATLFFHLPPDRVVELGAQIEICEEL
jgi:K+ transporter